MEDIKEPLPRKSLGLRTLEQKEPPQSVENTSNWNFEETKSESSFSMAIVGGLLASIVCVFIWTLITVATHYQIAYMAIGVGFAVGFSIQKMGKGTTPIYGILGAILSLFTCLLGNLLSNVFLYANDYEDYTYWQAISDLDLETCIYVVTNTFDFVDLLFYGVAIYTGFAFSIKSEND